MARRYTKYGRGHLRDPWAPKREPAPWHGALVGETGILMALVLLLLFGGGCALVVLVRGTPSNWAGYNISAALTGVNSRRTSLYVWQLIVAFTLLSLLAWGTAANSDYSWADWRTQHVLAGITALGLIATLAALIALW